MRDDSPRGGVDDFDALWDGFDRPSVVGFHQFRDLSAHVEDLARLAEYRTFRETKNRPLGVSCGHQPSEQAVDPGGPLGQDVLGDGSAAQIDEADHRLFGVDHQGPVACCIPNHCRFEDLLHPPGHEPFPRSVLEIPPIGHYAAGFGSKAGDVGFVAEAESEPVGAAWVRLLRGDDRGYGYVDDDTPELTVAVIEDWRGKGVGTALLERLFEAVPRMSLSSHVRNPAMRLYRRLGFERVGRDGNSVTMLRRG